MASTPPLEVDWSASACVDACRALFNAAIAAQTQGRRVRVRYDNYEVEYKPEEYGQLATLYETLRSQCPDAQSLPSLQAGRRVRRGMPIWGTVRS